MNSIDEKNLLKSICEDNPNEANLIRDLLRINKSTTLQMRKRGIREQVERKIDLYISRNKL